MDNNLYFDISSKLDLRYSKYSEQLYLRFIFEFWIFKNNFLST